MVLNHDFKRFPELTNSQMADFYFESPHRQITEDFSGKCIDVHDGDTIKILWEERPNLPVNIRMSYIGAPELNEIGGIQSRDWLRSQILNRNVDILLSKKRVGKFGRILGVVLFAGLSMNEISKLNNFSIDFKEINRNDIGSFSKELEGII